MFRAVCVLLAGASVGSQNAIVSVVATATASAALLACLRGREQPNLPAWTVWGVSLGGLLWVVAGIPWWVGVGGAVVAWALLSRREPVMSCRSVCGRGWAQVTGTRLDVVSLAVATSTCLAGAWALRRYFADTDAMYLVRPLPLAAIILLAVTNSALEETIWRSACLSWLRSGGAADLPALGFQALSFGLAHWAVGLPGGWVGVLMTTAFGLAQGLLRLRTRTLLLPIAVHAWLDVVIGLSIR